MIKISISIIFLVSIFLSLIIGYAIGFEVGSEEMFNDYTESCKNKMTSLLNRSYHSCVNYWNVSYEDSLTSSSLIGIGCSEIMFNRNSEDLY